MKSLKKNNRGKLFTTGTQTHPYPSALASAVSTPFSDLMGYGLGRSPFFIVGNTVENKWGQHRIKHCLACNRQPYH